MKSVLIWWTVWVGLTFSVAMVTGDGVCCSRHQRLDIPLMILHVYLLAWFWCSLCAAPQHPSLILSSCIPFAFWGRLVSVMVREEQALPDVLISFWIGCQLWPVAQGYGLHKCFCPSSGAGGEASIFFLLLLSSHGSGDSPGSLDYNFEDFLLAYYTSSHLCVCVCVLICFYLGTMVVLDGVLVNGLSSSPPHAMGIFQCLPLKLSSIFL